MPLILTEKNPLFGKCVLWSSTEDESFFRYALEAAGLPMTKISKWHPKRQKEWMSGRYLVNKYMEEDITKLTVDDHGKPSFKDSDYNFSISHTQGLVGLLYHTHPIGLDIQITTDKIARVAHKFCTDKEYGILRDHFDQQMSEHLIWGLKEAVFKAYGRGSLSYKNHIFIESYQADASSKRAMVRLEKEGVYREYQAKISLIGPYYICQVVEESNEHDLSS